MGRGDKSSEFPLKGEEVSVPCGKEGEFCFHSEIITPQISLSSYEFCAIVFSLNLTLIRKRRRRRRSRSKMRSRRRRRRRRRRKKRRRKDEEEQVKEKVKVKVKVKDVKEQEQNFILIHVYVSGVHERSQILVYYLKLRQIGYL